ncbi:hypothetical protein [Homoserinibacter sp. GY 40078]|uniref:hypothetical protein n=1 Tax=Homoserinibacter sp. GY 40078 TaxID=2603275 RepID=UPI0011CCA1A5|nr:hypothetical protein [Homoserinibacter sp. GY 40078]TXK18851.1 hypothetical protein FVQ89_02600 [Homoserinibacter sp. GY 40078]
MRRRGWRAAIVGAAIPVGVGLLVLFAPGAAHADDGDGLVGGLLDKTTSVVSKTVDTVVEPISNVPDVPVVGKVVDPVVTKIVDPVVTEVVDPVVDTVDETVGATVGTVPIVGDLLGDHPVGDIVDPVIGTVDEVVDTVVGAVSDGEGPVIGGPGILPWSPADTGLPSVAVGAANAPEISAAAALAAVSIDYAARSSSTWAAVVRTAGDVLGPVLGDSAPVAVLSAAGGAGALAGALLGSFMLPPLRRGSLRPAVFRAPPAPVYATDSSPD